MIFNYISANIINGTPTAFIVYNATGKLVEQSKCSILIVQRYKILLCIYHCDL